jgi:protein SCO1
MMGKRWAAIVVMLFAATALLPIASFARSPWTAEYFPNVPVVTHDGRELKFYEDVLKGKIVVISFIYTSCSNICPLMTARLSQVKDMLGDRVGRDIFFYSITLDPILDGPEVLKEYAETYHAGPGWQFLTGTPENIDLIRYKLGERSRAKEEHQTKVLLGNDATREWGFDSAFSDLEHLAAAIRAMDPKWRGQVQTAAVAAAPTPEVAINIHERPGEGLFQKTCAACHTIGEGERVGPDLSGVTSRRAHDWLKSYLMAPDELRARHDPIATALDAAYPGTKMPNLGLSSGDADDLIAYLKAREAEAQPEGDVAHEQARGITSTLPPQVHPN